MHDWLFAFAFIAMVASPAMVAAIGGRKEYTPEPRPGLPVQSDLSFDIQRTLPPAAPKSFKAKKPSIISTGVGTLPVHHARGLANR